jgi:DNA-binding response OmpR family regulator
VLLGPPQALVPLSEESLADCLAGPQGTPVDLTAAQFDILVLLASYPGWVYGRGQIMESVWGTEFSKSRALRADA